MTDTKYPEARTCDTPAMSSNQAPRGLVPDLPSPHASDEKVLGASHRSIFTTSRVVFCCLALVVILAIALGVGFGLGLKHNEAGTGTNSQTINATSSASSTIYNETSLAAVTTLDNNRHVFFQDSNGSLRHTVFSVSNRSWSEHIDYVNLPKPPAWETPITALQLNQQNSNMTTNETNVYQDIQIFYLSADNYIATAFYPLYEGLLSSYADTFTGTAIDGSYLVTEGSRVLSVSSMTPTRNDTAAEALLVYEAPGREITALYGYFIGSAWQFQNVSEAIYTALAEQDADCVIWAPVAVSTPKTNGIQQVVVTFGNSAALHNTSAPSLYQLDFNKWTGSAPDEAAGYTFRTWAGNNDLDSLLTSDVLSYYLTDSQSEDPPISVTGLVAWVADQQLNMSSQGLDSLPLPTSYPHARLAWLSDTNARVTYFYHQLNDVWLAEDAYTIDVGWKSTNISIQL